MNNLLYKAVYDNFKSVFNLPVAVADMKGNISLDANDFKFKRVDYDQPITINSDVIALRHEKKLVGVPIFIDGDFAALLITETDIGRTIGWDTVRSFCQLIIRQFLQSHAARPDLIDLLFSRIIYQKNPPDTYELTKQLEIFGFDPFVPRLAIALLIEGFWSDYIQGFNQIASEKNDMIQTRKRLIDQQLRSLFTKSVDNIVAYAGSDIFLILKDVRATSVDLVVKLLNKEGQKLFSPMTLVKNRRVIIAVGKVSRNPSEMARTISGVFSLLSMGQKIMPESSFLTFDKIGVGALLITQNEQDKREFIEQTTAKLKGQDDLIMTLTSFLGANMNLTDTAKILKLHRNTIIYRLEKITEITGCNPRNFDDAMKLKLSLMLQSVFGET